MKSPAIRWTVTTLLGLFAAQAVVLQATQRSVLLTIERTPVYIFEGDLVSGSPPTSAEEAVKTKEAIWMTCRYWTGLRVSVTTIPSVNGCPKIGG